MGPKRTGMPIVRVTTIVVVLVIGVIVFVDRRQLLPLIHRDPRYASCVTLNEVMYETNNLTATVTPSQELRMRQAVRGLAALEEHGGPATTVLDDLRSGGSLVPSGGRLDAFASTAHDFVTLLNACDQIEG